MTIYLDVVLIENIIMNYIILYATGIIYKIKPKNIRLFLSSIIGALYAILAYMEILDEFVELTFKLILSVSMVYIGLKPQNMKILLKQVLLFYLTSFIFGGISFALLYFAKPQDILTNNGTYIGMYPVKVVFLSGIVGFIIIKISFKIIKGKISKKELLCKIKIKILQKTVEATAMIDTGNLLKEPITGTSVIVVEKQVMADVIPESILNNLDNILKGEYSDNLDKFITKLRAIPFSSLGKANGMLIGIKPDEVLIKTEQEEIYVSNIVIGIYNARLSKNGLYSALIGLDILEGSSNNEFITIAKKQY